MNIQDYDILRTLLVEPFINQRILSETTGRSLGAVNRSLKSLTTDGYLDDYMHPTPKALKEVRDKSPRNAIILAAGFGMRMVPINMMSPKALLEVHGEPLIERQIRHLREAGIRDITIVVGFMKEAFDYLIDKYDVDLIVNPLYAGKNNLYSLSLAAERISNTYIIPSDIWCVNNPFHKYELYSWYMVSDDMNAESEVRVNRKMELVRIPEKKAGNTMVGISYLSEKEAAKLRANISRMAKADKYDNAYWESALYSGDKMFASARLVSSNQIVEINTYEQLRELDAQSNNLKSGALDTIASVFGVCTGEIVDITVLKKGMTNRSFLFSVKGEKYIMRIPGEGTDQLIDRREEADVFRTISGLGLCDDPVYINPENGFKITRFLEGVRVADTDDLEDLRKCMNKLRQFHSMKLKVPHTFDLFGQIEFYESLWNGKPSVYRDYKQTKKHVFELKEIIDAQPRDWCLTHIDAVPDNFLFHILSDGTEALQLTDWEYAGMQDPHLDIAMWCIYSCYGKKQVDRLIDIYFENKCSLDIRRKIYCYIAAAGLLWSNWCEYKAFLGVEFGEYAMKQYRFAKDYYRFAMEETEKEND